MKVELSLAFAAMKGSEVARLYEVRLNRAIARITELERRVQELEARDRPLKPQVKLPEFLRKEV